MRFLVWMLCIVGLLLSVVTPMCAEACSDAPPPRLEAEASGQVTPGVRGLRLRALPAVGAGTLLNINDGTAFTVISGPSCNGGYNWWRVELSNGTRGWLAEGTWSQYYVMPTANLTLCDGVQSPWLYALVRRVCDFVQAAL